MAKGSENKDKKEKKSSKSNGFKDFKAELKKVVWPTSKELVNSTVAVIAIVLITAIIVLVLDIAFDLLNTYGIDRIRSVYSSNIQSSEDDADNGATEVVEDNSDNSSEDTSNTEGKVEEETTTDSTDE